VTITNEKDKENNIMDVVDADITRKRPAENTIETIPKKTNYSPSASNEHVYRHPSLDETKQYTTQDDGPFLVHLYREDEHSKSNTYINPMQVGKLLHNAKIKNISRQGVKKIGRNRVSIEFTTAIDANEFITNSVLSTNKFAALIPRYNITRTVVITFRGQVLPERIFCCYTSLPVETYELPTIQCNKCCRFGHIQTQCRSAPRCFRCAQPHAGAECSVTELTSSCLLCLGNHFATNKTCPEHTRQRSIKSTMSQENVSYAEASARIPNVKQLYSNVTRAMPSQPTIAQATRPYDQTTTSYRKTVITPARPRNHSAEGYDRSAHSKLISQRDPPPPENGALLGNTPTAGNDNLLDIILSLLINMLTKFSDVSPPSNVAQKLNQLFEIVNIHNNTVECTQSASQEV
jgi:hypothetical protein